MSEITFQQTRMVNLAAFSVNSLICGLFLYQQNLFGAFFNVFIAGFHLGNWFYFCTDQRHFDDAHKLIRQQAEVIRMQHDMLKLHNLIP